MEFLAVKKGSAFELAQPDEVENGDAGVFDAKQALAFEDAQRLVHALPRQADELPQLFLRDRQRRSRAGIEVRVEQRRKPAREPRVGAEEAIVLDEPDELP